MIVATSVNADKSKYTGAELTARLLRIQPVSWRWNVKGIALDLFSRRIFKPWNRTEIGVIAQNVRDELGELYPEIVIKNRARAWTVDYGAVSTVAYDNLVYLDKKYQRLVRSRPDTLGAPLNFTVLFDKYRTDDMQLMAVRLLSLVRVYDERLQNLMA